MSKKWEISYTNDWLQLLKIGRCHWYTFTLCEIYFEWDKVCKGIELVCIVAGIAGQEAEGNPASKRAVAARETGFGASAHSIENYEGTGNHTRPAIRELVIYWY